MTKAPKECKYIFLRMTVLLQFLAGDADDIYRRPVNFPSDYFPGGTLLTAVISVAPPRYLA
jgi:hypothetical protein